MAGNTHDRQRSQKDVDATRVQLDEQATQAVMETVDNMINPFECLENNLVQISSGAVASKKVTDDLMKAKEIGNSARVEFCGERLQSNQSDFFGTLKKLLTFANLGEEVSKQVKGKQVTLKASRDLFAGLLIISKIRNVNMQEVLSYSLGPVLLPIASENG